MLLGILIGAVRRYFR